MYKIIHHIKNIISCVFEIIFPKSQKRKYLEKLSTENFEKMLCSGHYENIYYFFSYENKDVRDAIWEIKYRRNKILREKLSITISLKLLEEISDKITFEGFENPVVSWIPQDKRRKNDRGWNQSKDLAYSFAKHVSLTTEDFLEKKKETESQTKLGRTKRLQNMKGVFSVKNKKFVKGRNIILIDDVVTTGATLNESRKVLLKAGARKVMCIALAH